MATATTSEPLTTALDLDRGELADRLTAALVDAAGMVVLIARTDGRYSTRLNEATKHRDALMAEAVRAMVGEAIAYRRR